MVYYVNKAEKKLIAKEIRKKRGAKVSIPTLIYRILFMLIISLVLCEAVFWLEICHEEDELRFILGVIGVCIVTVTFLLLAIVPLCIRSYVIRKYLMPWVGMKDEEVLLEEDRIVHKFMNIFWQGYREKIWWTFDMKYEHIKRIEYDEYQKLLRIYGAESSKKWADRELHVCVSSSKANPKQEYDNCLEIPAYFGGLEDIKSRLKEKTGLEITDCTRPFATYR